MKHSLNLELGTAGIGKHSVRRKNSTLKLSKNANNKNLKSWKPEKFRVQGSETELIKRFRDTLKCKRV